MGAAADSSVAGYLAPSGSPPDDAALDLLFQPVIAGITGLDGTLVRRKGQEIPGPQPTRETTWCAFGSTVTDADTNSSLIYDGTANGGVGAMTQTRSETIDVSASFFGPAAVGTAKRLREGFGIAQNREQMRASGLAYVGMQRITFVPDLQNTQFIRRADVVFRVRRMVVETYAIRSIVEIVGTLTADAQSKDRSGRRHRSDHHASTGRLIMSGNTGLNPNRVISTTISLSTTPAGFQNFGSCLVIGPSNVIDVTERRRQYSGLTEFGVDFASNTPEYAWAVNFFSQKPQPGNLFAGRWAQTATSGLLHGASLTPAQRLLTLFTAVTSGSMLIFVDGVPYALTGLNFSAAINLNGVAAIIQTALQGAGASGALVVWGANNNRFDVISGTTGVTSSVSYAASPTAIDKVTFAVNPVANSTLTLNGTVVTFVATGATGNQVNIGASTAATLGNLLTMLNASVDTQIVKFKFANVGNILYVLAAAIGTAGNALTVAASVATVATSTLAGGSGTDVSVLLGLSLTPTTSGANADTPVNGIAAETLLSAVEYFDENYSDWYALAAAATVADSDHISAAAYIEGTTRARLYGVSTENTECYDDTRTDDLASLLNSYGRTMIDFSTQTAFSIASVFGRFATVNYQGSNTALTLKFKTMPGIMPETLTDTQADTLDGKNVNYYVTYLNGASILENGVMCNGTFIDSRINADWLANYVQTNAFNFVAGLPTKLPQTDAGMNLLKTNMTQSCQQGIVNGYGAPGVWNSESFGTLNEGDFLPLGFYIYVPLVASQNETDRAARKTPPFQIAFKEAGAVHSADVSIIVNP